MKFRKLAILIFVFFNTKTFAQQVQILDTTRWLCTYNYEFLQDSTSRYSLKSEQMTLQIASHLSKFCSTNQLLTDSLIYALRNEELGNAAKKIGPFIGQGHYTNLLCNYKIYKNFPGKDTLIFTAYEGGKFLKVVQHEKYNWKIEDKDSLLLGYRCQKATFSFAGRSYVAWFTPEIPINDGPYKFAGLPGLIVKISDTKGQHCFTLTSIRKPRYIQPITFNKSDYINISAREFLKALHANIASLFGRVQGGDITITSDDGKARSLQGLKSLNNFIERY